MGYATLADKHALELRSPVGEAWTARTVYELLSQTAATYPRSLAVGYQLQSGPKDRDWRLTWEDLRGKTAQTANLFRSLGVSEKDTVSYILPNALETVYTLLGGITAGIVNPINPLLEPAKIASLLREANTRVVVTLKAFPQTDVAAKVADALRDAPNVETVLEIDLVRYLSPPKSWIVPFVRPKHEVQHKARVLDFNKELAKHSSKLSFEESGKDRVAAYFHTGGTTGMPKIAQHRFSGMIYNGWIGKELLFSESDVILCPLPLFHVFAAYPGLMSAVASGAAIVFPTPQGYRGKGVFENFWKLVERWRATYVITVPTAASALMQRPVDADISTLRNAFSGSAPMPLELFRRFENVAGIKILEGYGLTEATTLVSVNPPDGERKVGSVGLPFPHTDIRILRFDETGVVTRECHIDEIGEICVKSPGVIPGGTYKDPARNEKLYAWDEYLRTGDLGRIDEDGYLYITGRAKDVIIRGGHNIDPGVIEEALATHPAVAFAGAIGQPDKHAGEVPCAYVELVAGGNVSIDELMEHAQANIGERAAVPKHIEILPSLPKTAVGKVLKPELRKAAMTRVFSEAFEADGIRARVFGVFEHRRLGLTTIVEATEKGVPDEEIERCLGGFACPWEWYDHAKHSEEMKVRGSA